MLTELHRAELATLGHTRLAGVVSAGAAAAMADAVWAGLAARGIDRADPSTWPDGSPRKLQRLTRDGVFDGFATPGLLAAVAELLGPDGWAAEGSWGPALVTFPQAAPWTLPHQVWHLDLPGRGDPDRHFVARLFGFATDVAPRGGGTLVVEGSHELVRRMVAVAPGHEAGSSADLRKRLVAAHPWFRALSREGGDRIAQFMVDGDEVDGVRVRVAELTGAAGDVAIMLPWTLHNLSMNAAATPRFMVTQTYLRADQPYYLPAAATSGDGGVS